MTVGDYRPITLYNVFYKIISKILTLRLQPILNGIISENQSAFVPGRAISDNVMITHEVLHFLKISSAKKQCSMTVKTDMSKAYDRIEWDFLTAVQRRMGFHPKWINWIHQCVSSVTYSYLIIIRLMDKKAQGQGSLHGIHVATNSPRVNHLLFADDTMFFCKSSTNNCKALKRILQEYEQASGQKINVDKSSITFSAKTSQVSRSQAKQILGIVKERSFCPDR
ncbi:unnamed protein product [Microthlaspi erraticum]|uniref:Reverse transcriptase domain-containing protein n=1 Tax=Microthlaspi erraticum TaxID=1685480 RepID=A0A6D2J5V8_9BRAS|nr:unnamed protein product [Microthlaspi erraticum]